MDWGGSPIKTSVYNSFGKNSFDKSLPFIFIFGLFFLNGKTIIFVLYWKNNNDKKKKLIKNNISF